MNFQKKIIFDSPTDQIMRYCNGSNDCGHGENFDKVKNTQIHGQNQKRDSNGGSCPS